MIASIRGDVAEEVLFTRAADLARSQGIDSDAALGPLLDNPPADADPEILVRLRQMYEAGAWVLVESALADLPTDLRWLYESSAVTLEEISLLHHALGLTSAADLREAVLAEAIRSVSGLGEAQEAAIAAALPDLRVALPRIPLGRATATLDPVLARLRDTPGVLWATPVGSLRRGQETVGDIDVVAVATDPEAAIAGLTTLPDVIRCLHRGARRVCLLLERVQITVRFTEPAIAGAVLVEQTGSAGHLAKLRTHADGRSLRLSGSGLFAAGGERLPSATEEEVYSGLGLPLIPAEIRNGDDEIDAALGGRLPTLLARTDIRGDLHMHTMWSDGKDTIDAMVEASLALGYEYIAITDHSQRSAASRNLTIEGVGKQAEEIARARERFPGITILHGCEVDIMPDGTLDFADRVLERFDIVLASLHERAGHGPDQLLKRYIGAMRHPLVTLITHPTNRLVPGRKGYDLDYERLFATAVDTRTVVEIDGAPVHLDLSGPLARQAIAAGAMIAVDSDCHRAELLDRQMDFGVTTARRGWVEARHVVNTRPLADIRSLIASKR